MKDLVIIFLLALALGSAVNAYKWTPAVSSEPLPGSDQSGAGLNGQAPTGAVGSAGTASSAGSANSAGSHGAIAVAPVGTTTDATFEKQVLKSDIPVLVDFSATWCGPCKKMAPIVDELASENRGRLKVYELDVDDNPQTADKYQTSGIPAFLIFKNGKVVESFVGARPKEVLAAAISKVCAEGGTANALSSAPQPGNNSSSSQDLSENNAVTANSEDIPLVDETGFDRDVIKSASPVLVFFCDRSDACKRTWPTVVSVATKVFDRYRVVRVDVTTHPAIAQQYFVNSTPTFVIFKNGQRYKQMTGVIPERDLLSFLEVQHTASSGNVGTY